jgi:RNA polymerase sigma-70 factor (ECF subfamily)
MPVALLQRVTPQDVLQETCLESERKLAAFEPQGPGSFYAWLVAIARYKIAEAERAGQAQKNARAHPLADSVSANDTRPSGHAVRKEGAERLREALLDLPERQAEAVRLRYLEGLSVAEAAQRLDCSEPALKALVSRGLMDLSERMLESS